MWVLVIISWFLIVIQALWKRDKIDGAKSVDIRDKHLEVNTDEYDEIIAVETFKAGEKP